MGMLSYAMTLRTAGFDRPLAASAGAVGRFGSTIGGATAKLAKLSLGLGAIIGPATAAGIAFKSFNAAADLEQTQVALRTLVGDIGKADNLLGKIRKLAAATPFQFPELADSTRKLIAFGTAADAVPDTLRRIGDIAAGVQAPIGELTELYGKARTQGTLYAEDLNQLTGRGIPILDEMAKILGVHVSQIKKMGSEGKLTFPLLEEAFRNLTGEGGKFFEMMKAQSQTTRGLMSTLKDSINEIFLVIGQPMNDAFKPILEGAIERSKLFGIQLQGIIQLFAEAGKQGQLGSVIGSSLQVAGIRFVNTISGGFRGAVAFLGEVVPRLFSGVGGIIWNSSLIQSIGRVFDGVADKIKQGGTLAAAAIVDALPGGDEAASDLRGLADAYGRGASANFGLAGSILETADFAAEFQAIADELQKAGIAGAEAWKAAASTPLLDESEAVRRMDAIFKSINPEAAARISRPQDFLPAGQDAETDTQTKGLREAIETATGKQEDAKTTTEQSISAMNRNTAALLKPAALPEALRRDPRRPTGGGGVFSVAESLARQFGRLENKGGMNFNDFVNKSIGGRRAVRDFARRNDLSLAEARKRLVEMGKAAAPGGQKKPPPKDPKIDLAREIRDETKRTSELLENLAVA